MCHRSSKPAPLVTQDFTYSLEDMIRRRVKEGRFNDVQLKVEAKPTATAAEGTVYMCSTCLSR